MTISPATTPEAIRRAYPVMRELRPHLADEAAFVQRVLRQQAQGYHLATLAEDTSEEIIAAAGYRFLENLSWGPFLFVDDLVTRSTHHGQGTGSALLRWLLNEARRHGCAEVHLESGVQRFPAHRFYLSHGFRITCHHFAHDLGGTGKW